MRVSTLAVVAGNALLVKADAPSAFGSNSDLSLKFTAQDAPVSGTGNSNGAATASWSMDDTDAGKKQQITGFGAALTDSTVALYNALSDQNKQNFINDMVGSSGGNFKLLRHTIASSDMSASEYSYADSGNSLDGFNLGQGGNDLAGLIKAMRDAQSDLTVLGSSWHAPEWMKQDNNYLNPANADAFAQYFVKYLQAYEAAGAHIDYLTIQNEPLHDNVPDFTMGMQSGDQVSYINNNVGPALQDANLTTAIWAYDHNTDHPEFPEAVISQCGEFVKTVAWHCYAKDVDWSVLTDFHNSHGDVDQVMTECYTYSDDQWTNVPGFTYGPLQNWATGAISWPMGTTGSSSDYLPDGCSTCKGIATLNGDNYDLNADYYMLGQFSKGIPKGAYIQNLTGGTDGMNAVASVNPDGTRAFVVQNVNGDDRYVTLTLQSNGAQWSGLVPANSMSTWTLPGQ